MLVINQCPIVFHFTWVPISNAQSWYECSIIESCKLGNQCWLGSVKATVWKKNCKYRALRKVCKSFVKCLITLIFASFYSLHGDTSFMFQKIFRCWACCVSDRFMNLILNQFLQIQFQLFLLKTDSWRNMKSTLKWLVESLFYRIKKQLNLKLVPM